MNAVCLNKNIALSVLFVLLLMIGAKANAQDYEAKYYLINNEVLDVNDEVFKTRIGELLARATEIIEKKRKYSVTYNKNKIAPSGNPNDYYSESPYYYVDDNGKVYKKDGVRNPLVNKNPDRRQMQDLIMDLKILSLAYHYTSDQRYSNWACILLNTWFVDESTRMNPHFQYAQVKPQEDSGSFSGIIESRDLVLIPDILSLFSGADWNTDQFRTSIQMWFVQYLDWLEADGLGETASRQPNNIGNFYDLQVYTYMLFTGVSKDSVRNLIENRSFGKICQQIDVDGSQPAELKRSKPIAYSLLNLRTFVQISIVLKNINLEVPGAFKCEQSSLTGAMDWLQGQVDNRSKHGKGSTLPVSDSQAEQFETLKLLFYVDEDSIKDYYKSGGSIVELAFSLM